MIYKYEEAVLRYFKSAIPALTLATYANREDMFTAMSSVKTMPSIFYYRDTTDWASDRALIINAQYKLKGFRVKQTYTGRISVETSSSVFATQQQLHKYISTHPHVEVPVVLDNTTLKINVGLRLLSIRADEEQSPIDTKGPIKFIEFKWFSFLYLLDSTNLSDNITGVQIRFDDPSSTIISEI